MECLSSIVLPGIGQQSAVVRAAEALFEHVPHAEELAGPILTLLLRGTDESMHILRTLLEELDAYNDSLQAIRAVVSALGYAR